MSETIAARDHDKPRFILPDNTFAIFQLKAGDDYHHLRFSSLKELNSVCSTTPFFQKSGAQST